MEKISSKRSYKSDKRQQQAETTRRAIIDAGRKLFSEHGYTATTVAAVAAEAGVAVPTVYASVGGKQGILRQLVQLVDELGDQTLIEQGLAESDPARVIKLAVTFHRQTIERGGDIINLIMSTAPFDEDVAHALEEALAMNREVAGKLVQLLAEQGSLRSQLSEKKAGDIIAVMFMPTIFDTLRHYGWSYDECEQWTADTLANALLSAG
jgi:AcrR family transcriptional regulator